MLEPPHLRLDQAGPVDRRGGRVDRGEQPFIEGDDDAVAADDHRCDLPRLVDADAADLVARQPHRSPDAPIAGLQLDCVDRLRGMDDRPDRVVDANAGREHDAAVGLVTPADVSGAAVETDERGHQFGMEDRRRAHRRRDLDPLGRGRDIAHAGVPLTAAVDRRRPEDRLGDRLLQNLAR